MNTPPAPEPQPAGKGITPAEGLMVVCQHHGVIPAFQGFEVDLEQTLVRLGEAISAK